MDSRAVVGLGERTLHLAPGAVIMYANGATTEDFRKSEVLWWVLLDDAQGGEYARLVPLPHYTPVCHRGRGWLHLIFLSLSSFIYYYHEIQENSR